MNLISILALLTFFKILKSQQIEADRNLIIDGSEKLEVLIKKISRFAKRRHQLDSIVIKNFYNHDRIDQLLVKFSDWRLSMRFLSFSYEDEKPKTPVTYLNNGIQFAFFPNLELIDMDLNHHIRKIDEFPYNPLYSPVVYEYSQLNRAMNIIIDDGWKPEFGIENLPYFKKANSDIILTGKIPLEQQRLYRNLEIIKGQLKIGDTEELESLGLFGKLKTIESGKIVLYGQNKDLKTFEFLKSFKTKPLHIISSLPVDGPTKFSYFLNQNLKAITFEIHSDISAEEGCKIAFARRSIYWNFWKCKLPPSSEYLIDGEEHDENVDFAIFQKSNYQNANIKLNRLVSESVDYFRHMNGFNGSITVSNCKLLNYFPIEMREEYELKITNSPLVCDYFQTYLAHSSLFYENQAESDCFFVSPDWEHAFETKKVSLLTAEALFLFSIFMAISMIEQKMIRWHIKAVLMWWRWKLILIENHSEVKSMTLQTAKDL